jgi:hypothetical protein
VRGYANFGGTYCILHRTIRSVSGHEKRHNCLYWSTGNPTITNGNSTEPAGISGVAALPSQYSDRIFLSHRKRRKGLRHAANLHCAGTINAL